MKLFCGFCITTVFIFVVNTIQQLSAVDSNLHLHYLSISVFCPCSVVLYGDGECDLQSQAMQQLAAGDNKKYMSSKLSHSPAGNTIIILQGLGVVQASATERWP